LKGSVQQLRVDLQTLRDEIGLGPILTAAIDAATVDNPVLRSQRAIRSRRMAYVHGIVSIYGLLEEHIDSLIMEVAEVYSRLYSRYGDLPESVRRSHREYSLRVLLDGDRVRLREPIDEVSSLRVLASSYDDSPVRLNIAAFTYATANYRYPLVADLMRRLNIEIDRVVDANSVKEALSSSGLDFRRVDALIDDVVERRNEIVHSYNTTLELLDAGVLLAYLDVIAAYLEEMFSLASNHLLEILASRHLKPIGAVVHVWPNASAVGVDMSSGKIQAPCKVMIIKSPQVFMRNVQSLQSNNIPIDGILEYVDQTIQLGMSLDEALPQSAEGGKAYILPDQWAYLSI
jgi:hypothetical protein